MTRSQDNSNCLQPIGERLPFTCNSKLRSGELTALQASLTVSPKHGSTFGTSSNVCTMPVSPLLIIQTTVSLWTFWTHTHTPGQALLYLTTQLHVSLDAG